MRQRVVAAAFLLVLHSTLAASPAGVAAETEAWRAQREQDLKSETGWLTVAGLAFLHPGVNTVGSDRNSDVVLPASAPAHAGRFTREGTNIWFEAEPGSGVQLNGKPVETRIAPKPQDRLTIGAVSFHLHESGERIGVRIRDANSALRRTFRGLRWFPVREAWTIDARFVPYDQPREITVANVLGDYERLTLPGEAVFQVRGQEVRLQAARSGRRLWFIFSDGGAGRDTYRIRFLYADAPSADGKVTLDFNRAYNPPCAYNPYTTCPVPPPQNRLTVAIPAGERIYRSH
jgi:uncharacterized protein